MLLFVFQDTSGLAWLYEIGTIVGIAFLVFAFILMEKIVRFFPGGSLVKKWRVMQAIDIAFIVLYIVDWFVWIYDIHDLLFFIGGILRLTTGILVAIIVWLFYQTIKIVLHKTD